MSSESEAQLTRREHEVLSLVMDGLHNWQIAEQLCISEATVENHLHHAYTKLEVSNRIEAVVHMLRQELCQK